MTVIKYIPVLNEVTGGVYATLFLIQSHFWFKQMGYKPFYKYVGPCGHFRYKNGDSWLEELGFRKSTVKSVKRNIGSFIDPQRQYYLTDLQLILYWKEYPNTTYYLPNYVAMSMVDENVFSEKHFPHFRAWNDKLKRSEIPLSEITFQPSQRLIFPLSYIQENTSERVSESTSEKGTEDEVISILPFNNSEIFAKAWTHWKGYLKEKYSGSYSAKEELTILKSLEKYEDAFVCAIIEEAILKGWKHFIFQNTDEKYQKFISRSSNLSQNETVKPNYSIDHFLGENGKKINKL